MQAAASPDPEKQGKIRVAVVGDTGIGERGFHAGFLAVQQAMVAAQPDILFHMGDFAYQPHLFPGACDPKYVQEIRESLVKPFPMRLFVPGDNDLPPKKFKPKASGCWAQIDPLDTPFDRFPESTLQPGPFAGTKVIGNLFFAVLNAYPWKDPTAWLRPRVEAARQKGQWILIGVHLPPVTTAWYKDWSQTALKQINALRPDLVFSGNQHSYERFHPLGVPGEGGRMPVSPSDTSVYKRGAGTIHIVSGGGGAMLRPFADLQGSGRIAPEHVRNAIAKRAIANHFVLLEVSKNAILGTTYMLCPADEDTFNKNYRWLKWKQIAVECDGKPQGSYKLDRFEIHR